jgi:hypothetical protein
LEKLSSVKEETPVVNAILIDGAVIVNMVRPGSAKTFSGYGKLITDYIRKQLGKVSRIDVIWDEYSPDSLKMSTR